MTGLYSKKDGTGTIAKTVGHGKRLPKWIKGPDGAKRYRDLGAELRGCKKTQSTGWPKKCMMSGVLPSQVPQAIEHCKAQGVNVEFQKNGEPIWTSQRHADRYCRAMGLFDKQSVTMSPRNK